MIDEYPYNKKPKRSCVKNLAAIEDYLSRFWSLPAVVLGSGRVGYYYALKFFGLKRQDHVLIPDFMCQAILNITNTSGYPVKVIDGRTKAVLVFHQWGYPQKMDEVLAEARKRNLLVIEDCAHGFDSKYKGKLAGTFGQAAVFSFAKVFPTYLGGVLVSGNPGLIEHVKQDRARKNHFSNQLFNFVAGRIAKKSFEQGQARFWLDIVYLKSIHYPNLGLRYSRYLPASLEEFEAGLAARKRNYLLLKNSLKKDYLIPDRDEEIDPNPYLVPVFLPEEKLMPTREQLLKQEILTDILHFDTNRNVFYPLYRKCLAVPCHQAIERQDLQKMAEIINQA